MLAFKFRTHYADLERIGAKRISRGEENEGHYRQRLKDLYIRILGLFCQIANLL